MMISGSDKSDVCSMTHAVTGDVNATVDYAEGHSFFPLSYYVGFLEYLAKNSDVFEVITYDDLPWEGDHNWSQGYPNELLNWQKWLSADRRRKDKIYILLQHDVDSFPEMSMRVLREEERLGVRSNVMLFNRRLHRQIFEERGDVVETDYDIDWPYLDSLVQNKGFVAGYHCNAYERAGFDGDAAQQLFRDDIKSLASRTKIEIFSAHGGPRDTENRSNRCISVPEELRTKLRWVHNGGTPRFAAQYSDGGVGRGLRSSHEYDLRSFVSRMKRGERYRVLTHPQYYAEQVKPTAWLCGQKWYDDAIAEKVDCESENAAYWGPIAPPPRSVPGKILRKASVRVLNRLRVDHVVAKTRPPVFVRAVSRSGGTLVVTMLDAHPDIAMSYELYPNLLHESQGDETPGHAEYSSEPHLAGDCKISNIAGVRANYRFLFGRGRSRNVRTFFNRCQRSGLDTQTVKQLFWQHVRSGSTLEGSYGHLRFIERCGAEKMARENKTVWGAKCSNQFHTYHDIWPDACFIDVVRDGRDVLASQLNTGGFAHDIERIGRKWAETHELFDKFVSERGARGIRISYEDLVRSPRAGAEKLCDIAGVEFDESMLRFYEDDLTIFRNETGHLSRKRISVPIDESQVGRWKRDLNAEQLNSLEAVCGEWLEKLGYSSEDVAA